MPTRRIVSVTLLGLAVSLTAITGEAQPKRTIHSEAEEEFRRGSELLDDGRPAEALRSLRESHALEPGRGKLYLIAICEEKLGKLATASLHFLQVAHELDRGDERLRTAEEHVLQMAPRIPRLRVVGVAEGATVVLDDEPLSASILAAEIPLDPGRHVVIVTSKGALRTRYEIDLGAGETTTLEASPPVPDTSAASGVAYDPPGGRGRRVGGVISLGVGAVGIALGSVAVAGALRNRNEAERDCPSHVACGADAVAAAKGARTLWLASTTAFIAGALGVGTGVYLLVTPGVGSGAGTRAIVVRAVPGGGALGWERAF